MKLTPLERRLRRVVAGLAMVIALLALVLAAILLYWRSYLLSPDADPFKRGPFVTRVGPTSAALAWSLPGKERVTLIATAPDGTTVVGRQRSFTGLKPGRRYLWTASIGGIGRASGSFRTPPPDLSEPVTFAAIGDYGSGGEHEYAVGRTLAAERPDFVVTAGDNSYLFAAPQLLDRNIFEPLREVMAHAPLWATMGEHDLFLNGGAAITKALDLPGERGRYVIDYGPIQLVFLGLEAGRAELAFARGALARPGPRVRFVIVHRPIKPGNPILPVLRRAGVAAIFSGHLHRYERRVVAGVLEFVVGTSGRGPGDPEFTRATAGARISLLDYGSLRVLVSRGGIEYQFIDERGRVLDRVVER